MVNGRPRKSKVTLDPGETIKLLVAGLSVHSLATSLTWCGGLHKGSIVLFSGRTSILIGHREDELGNIHKVTAEDNLTAQLQLEDGVTALCQISNCQVGGDGMKIEVWGTDGVLIYRHTPPFLD